MKPRGSNRNLMAASTTTATKKETLPAPKIESWQPRVLSVEGPQHNCWLIDSAADVHVCNNRFFMIKYYNKPIRIGGSTFDGSSPGTGKIRLWLSLEDGSEGFVLNLQNFYYLPSSPSNLISLGLLNDGGVLHNNENKTLYQLTSKKIPAQARQWRNSYLLKPLNLSNAAVSPIKIDDKTYKWPSRAFFSLSSSQTSFPITICLAYAPWPHQFCEPEKVLKTPKNRLRRRRRRPHLRQLPAC